MSRTPSTMLPLGTAAPDFALTDVTTGTAVTRDSARGEHGLLVMFICRHCPFVKHVEAVLTGLGTAYIGQGIGIVAISANDTDHYPEDNAEGLRTQARQCGFAFPYCLDDDQSVAKAYRAACTPDLFLFDANLELYYRGQLDGSRPGNDVPVTGQDLRAALDALLAGHPAPDPQHPSIGCNIKWKPGNAPDYFSG